MHLNELSLLSIEESVLIFEVNKPKTCLAYLVEPIKYAFVIWERLYNNMIGDLYKNWFAKLVKMNSMNRKYFCQQLVFTFLRSLFFS